VNKFQGLPITIMMIALRCQSTYWQWSPVPVMYAHTYVGVGGTRYSARTFDRDQILGTSGSVQDREGPSAPDSAAFACRVVALRLSYITYQLGFGKEPAAGVNDVDQG
jgi:hypothetical protein